MGTRRDFLKGVLAGSAAATAGAVATPVLARETRPRPPEALGLLYRGLLSRLLHDFRLPLKSSNTENEVLQLIQQLDQQDLSQFSRQLTRHWQGVAYGHQLPPAEAGQQLCNEWRALFPHLAGRV